MSNLPDLIEPDLDAIEYDLWERYIDWCAAFGAVATEPGFEIWKERYAE